ncbi:MAG: oligosaccharide flippase family protein [Christensenellales bacterium]
MKKGTRRNSFLLGAVVLSAGGFIAKILGAVYRIPLTNMLGSYGMGLYQLVFPMYSLVLTLSGVGFSMAVSKMVAARMEQEKTIEAKRVFTSALIILFILGVLNSLILLLGGDLIAKIQGNANLGVLYRLISPSVLLVCLVSAFKGYFQGKMNMAPTALSQICEQVIKLAAGLYLAYLFMPDIEKAVGGAVFAVTLSEGVALTVFAVIYFFDARKEKKALPLKKTAEQPADYKSLMKELTSIALPLTLGGLIMPVSQLIDSALVLNLVKAGDATTLTEYGAVPFTLSSVCPWCLSEDRGGVLPAISRAHVSGNKPLMDANINSALKLTNVIALPCVLGFACLSRQIVRLLYSALPEADLSLAGSLLALSSVSILFLALSGTCTSIMQGTGKIYYPLMFLGISCIVKIALNLILMPLEQINIYAFAISTTICYLLSAALGLRFITRRQNVKIDVMQTFFKPLACTLAMTVTLLLFSVFASDFVNTTLGTVTAILAGGTVYAAMIVLLKVFGSVNKVYGRIKARLTGRTNEN